MATSQAHLARLEATKSNLLTRLSRFHQDQHSLLTLTLPSLQQPLQSLLDSHLDSARSHLTSLETDISTNQEELTRLQATQTTLEAQLSILVDQCQRREQENINELEGLINQQREDIVGIDRACSQINKEIKATREKQAIEAKGAVERERKMREVIREVKRVKEEGQSREKERIRVQEEVNEVNRQVEERKLDGKEREARIVLMKEQQERVEGENETLKRQREVFYKEIEKEPLDIDKLKEEVERNNREIDQIRDDILIRQEQVQDLQKKLDETAQVLKDKSEEKELSSLFSQTQQNINEFNHRASILNQKLISLPSPNSQKNQTLQALINQLQSLRQGSGMKTSKILSISFKDLTQSSIQLALQQSTQDIQALDKLSIDIESFQNDVKKNQQILKEEEIDRAKEANARNEQGLGNNQKVIKDAKAKIEGLLSDISNHSSDKVMSKFVNKQKYQLTQVLEKLQVESDKLQQLQSQHDVFSKQYPVNLTLMNVLEEQLGLQQKRLESSIDHELPNMTQYFDALRQKYLHLENEDGFDEGKGEMELSEGSQPVSDIHNFQELLQRALKDKEKVGSVSHDTLQKSQLQSQLDDIIFQLNKSAKEASMTPEDLEGLETQLFELECQLLRENGKGYKRATEDQKLKQKSSDQSYLNLNQLVEKVHQDLKDLTLALDVLQKQELTPQKDLEKNRDLKQMKQQQEVFNSRYGVLESMRKKIEAQKNSLQEDSKSLSLDGLTKRTDDLSLKTSQALEEAKSLDALSSSLQRELRAKQDLFNEKHKVYSQVKDLIGELNDLLSDIKQGSTKNSLKLCEILKVSELIVPNDSDGIRQALSYINNTYKNLQRESRQKDDLITELAAEFQGQCGLIDTMTDQLVSIQDLAQLQDYLQNLSEQLHQLRDDQEFLSEEVSQLQLKTQSTLSQNKQEISAKLLELLKSLGLCIPSVTDEKLTTINQKIEDASYILEEAQSMGIANPGILALIDKTSSQLSQLQDRVSQLESGPIRDSIENYKDQEQTIKELDLESSTPQGLLALLNGLNQLNAQHQSAVSQLDKVYQEVMEIHSKLQDALKLHSDAEEEANRLKSLVDQAQQNLFLLQSQLGEFSEMSSQLRQLLEDVDTASNNEFKARQAQVQDGFQVLGEVEDGLFGLDEVKETIASSLQDVLFKREALSHPNQLQIRPLCQIASGLIGKLEDASKQCISLKGRLEGVRSSLQDLDIPSLKELRLNQIQELDQVFRELIKAVETKEFSPELQDQLNEYFQNINIVRQELKGLYKTLQAVINPNSDISLLQIRQSVEIIIQTRLKLQEMHQKAKDLDVQATRILHQASELDMQHFLADLEKLNQSHLDRLESISKRIDLIGKGADDCNGYTSNPEEGTFIETLLGELPEIRDKLKSSQDLSDLIQFSLLESRDRPPQEVETSLLNEQMSTNEKSVAFLEKLVTSLEDHFYSLNLEKKLNKRKTELHELKQIAQDFADKLGDMSEHLRADLAKLTERSQSQRQIQSMTGSLLLDEEGNPVDLLAELSQVQEEIRGILAEVEDMQVQNEEIRARRDEAEKDLERWEEERKGQVREGKDDGVFWLIKVNGQTKKKIIGLIKQLKDVSKRIKTSKAQYQGVREKLEKQAKPRKLYKAVVGDVVDELFADYINRLGCPVPVKRVGPNMYNFGTKKVSAKIINGRLVIRVGGGYMGIEEFMMYYGQQELAKIQKEEQICLVQDELEKYENDEDIRARVSMTPRVDINKLQWKIREQQVETLVKDGKSPHRQSSSQSMMTPDVVEDSKSSSEGNTNVVGIAQVRKALKHNVIQVQTYEENKTGQSQISRNPNAVVQNVESLQSELKKIESQIANKEQPLRQTISAQKPRVNQKSPRPNVGGAARPGTSFK